MTAKKKPAKKTRPRKATPKKGQPRTAPNVWRKAFLAALAQTGNVTASARAARIDPATAHHVRQEDETFAAAWKDALDQAADLLELEARRRAHDGLRRLQFYKGQPILLPVYGEDGCQRVDDKGDPVFAPYVEHEYSDTLLIFLLKAARPEKYRDRAEVEHKGGVRLEIVEEIVDAPGSGP